VYAPLLNRIGALSLDAIWGFETTSSQYFSTEHYYLEAISKKGFWFKIKAGPSFNPQVRLRRIEGLEARTQRRGWAKRLF